MPLHCQECCVDLFAKVVLAGGTSEHLDLPFCIGSETASHILGLEEKEEHLWSKLLPSADTLFTISGR